MKTAAERKRKSREKMEQGGLKRLELYAHPGDHRPIKEYAAYLKRKRWKHEQNRD